MCDVFVPVCSLYLSTPYYICISVSLFLLSSAVSSSTREGDMAFTNTIKFMYLCASSIMIILLNRNNYVPLLLPLLINSPPPSYFAGWRVKTQEQNTFLFMR